MEANDEEMMTIHCKLDGEQIQLSRDAARRAEALRDMMEDTESNVLPVELRAPPVCLVAAMLKHDAAVAAGADGETTFSLAEFAPEALADATEAAHHLLASEAFAALVSELFHRMEGLDAEARPLGPNVWVHQQAARPRLPHNPEDESHGARLFPTLGHRLWAPCAYVPLWHEGRQQLAVIRRCRTYLYLDREGVHPHLGHHDGSRDRDPVSPPGGSVAGSECDSEEDADDHGSDADEAGADGLGEDFGGEAW